MLNGLIIVSYMVSMVSEKVFLVVSSFRIHPNVFSGESRDVDMFEPQAPRLSRT